MKVPAKYEPKDKNEFKHFDDTMRQILSVPHSEVKRLIDDEKKEKQQRKKKKVVKKTT